MNNSIKNPIMKAPSESSFSLALPPLNRVHNPVKKVKLSLDCQLQLSTGKEGKLLQKFPSIEFFQDVSIFHQLVTGLSLLATGCLPEER